MADCLATENSWCLSQNFERDCKERARFQIDDDINFSLDMVTHSDEDDHHSKVKLHQNECNACDISVHMQNPWDALTSPKQQRSNTRNKSSNNLAHLKPDLKENT